MSAILSVGVRLINYIVQEDCPSRCTETVHTLQTAFVESLGCRLKKFHVSSMLADVVACGVAAYSSFKKSYCPSQSSKHITSQL